MDYKIFIGYSSEDNEIAQHIYSCLGKVAQFKPYKAELYQTYGEDFKQRIQNELYASHFMVVLLTENGKNSQWVNQEIGFAYSLKKRPEPQYKGMPSIIPLSHRQVNLKGFITKDTIDLLILDNFPSFELVIANIILAIRCHIVRGLEEGTLELRITCSNCFDKRGFPYEFGVNMPDNETLRKSIALHPQPRLQTICPKCKHPNFIDARSLLPVQE